MYYIWKHELAKEKSFFTCKLENFKDKRKLMNREKNIIIPDGGLNYITLDKDLIPEDYTRTGTIFNFLVSDKIVNVLKGFDLDIDYIPSKIVRRNNEIIDNYKTLNIYSVISCADLDESDVTIDDSNSYFTDYTFKKLVLNDSLIPENERLFWLGEKETWLVVHQDIVDSLEKSNVTGISFIPIDEFNCH